MRKSSRKIILAMLLSILLTGCGVTEKYTRINWVYCNTASEYYDGKIALRTGYVVTSCDVDYENNIVVMKIEKE